MFSITGRSLARVTLNQTRSMANTAFGTLGSRIITCHPCGRTIDPQLVKQSLDNRTMNPDLFAKCQASKKYSFRESKECQLVAVVKELTPLAKSYNDIEINYAHALVLTEALKPTPRSGLDLTGDHGSRLIPRVLELIADGTLEEPVGLIDVGGLNTDTVDLFDPTGAKQHVIVDISALTPRTTAERSNIQYKITDAEDFFDTSASSEITRIKGDTGGPVAILMNNLINVLPASKGLATLRKAVASMSSGDQLIISGLPTNRFKSDSDKTGVNKGDGLVEYTSRKDPTFKKTAIDLDTFTQTLTNLDGISLKVAEEFYFDDKHTHSGVRFALVKD